MDDLIFLGRIRKCLGSVIDFQLGSRYLGAGGISDVCVLISSEYSNMHSGYGDSSTGKDAC